MSTIHHLHTRKRIYKKLEQYPHPQKLKRVVDYLVYFASIAIPIFTLPQIYKIFSELNAQGVSPVSWGAYGASNLIWLFYGIVHKETPLILVNAIMMTLNFIVMLGAIIY